MLKGSNVDARGGGCSQHHCPRVRAQNGSAGRRSASGLQNGQVVGFVTDRDVCCRTVVSGQDPGTMTAREIMTGDVASCFEDQDCAEAARLMQEKHVRRLTVMNRNRTMVGIFSVDDLARYSHDLAGVVLEAASPWPH